MTDVSQYYPPPSSQDLYLASSKHFAQAKQMYEGLSGEEVSSAIVSILYFTLVNQIV